LEAENPPTRFQTPIERYEQLDTYSVADEIRSHRFSALVDGVCMGVGLVFILLGSLMAITSLGMLVQGLMSIIGGLVVLTTGVVVEVYRWAKLQE
jgi:hypothetical protein